MRPMNLIHLLLQNNSKSTGDESKTDRLMRLNRQAAIIYNQASREAGRDPTPGNYLLKEKIAIDARITTELAEANLADRQQYNTIARAVEAWQPFSHDLDGRSSQIIRKAVITACCAASEA